MNQESDCIEINSMVPENLIMIDGEPFSSESVKIYFDCKQKFNIRKEMEVGKEDLINGAFDDALDIIDRKANEVKHD